MLSVCSDDVEVTYNINSLWNNGGIIDVTLHNISDENIEDWTLSFSAGFNDNIWRAKLDKQDGNSYTVNNLGYNSIIKPDESETFGMQVSFSDALYKPETLSSNAV